MQIEEGIRKSLLVMLVCSWLFFPFMLKPLFPSTVIGGFLAVLTVVAYLNREAIGLHFFAFPVTYKPDIWIYFLYVLALVTATFVSQAHESGAAMGVVISRVVFFTLVLCLLNEKTVVAALDLYTRIVAALSFLALVSMLYRYFGGAALANAKLNSFDISVYYGAFYRQEGGYICPGLFPVQGLAEEPGTWAFSCLIALFWSQMARRSPLLVWLIGLNLIMTGSFGVALFLFGTAVLLYRQNSHIDPGGFKYEVQR